MSGIEPSVYRLGDKLPALLDIPARVAARTGNDRVYCAGGTLPVSTPAAGPGVGCTQNCGLLAALRGQLGRSI
jgi:hypothetical protein